MNLARFCMLAVASISLSGCYSMGKKVDTEKMTQFEKGKTTKQQVISAMGSDPNNSTANADGTSSIFYSYVASQTDPKTFIPIVGIFLGGSKVQTQNCNFMFDKKGLYLDGSCSKGSS